MLHKHYGINLFVAFIAMCSLQAFAQAPKNSCSELLDVDTLPKAYTSTKKASDYSGVLNHIRQCIDLTKTLDVSNIKKETARKNLAIIKSIIQSNIEILNTLAAAEKSTYGPILTQTKKDTEALTLVLSQVVATVGKCNNKPYSADLIPSAFLSVNGSKSFGDYNGVKTYIENCRKEIKEADRFNSTSERATIVKNLQKLKSAISSNQDKLTGATIGEDNLKLAFESQQVTSKLVNEINELLDIKKPNYLLPAFRDIAFSYQFYSGIEYNKVGGIFDDSNLRLGFQGYLRLGKSVTRMRETYGDGCDSNEKCGNWWNNMPHLIGNVQLTGAGEINAAQDASDNMEQGSDENNNEDSSGSNSNFDAIDYEVAMFYPMYLGVRGQKSSQTYQEFAFGPILTFGGRKTDDISSFEDRYYAGFRFANNEETYFDVMYGKSEPLKGRRVELRGQMPVSTLGSGKLFLGAVANFEVEKKRTNDEGNLT